MLLKILIALCLIKITTWLWPKIPKEWLKCVLGIHSPSKIHINAIHGSVDKIDIDEIIAKQKVKSIYEQLEEKSKEAADA